MNLRQNLLVWCKIVEIKKGGVRCQKMKNEKLKLKSVV